MSLVEGSPTFTRFPNLPPELRLLIWEYALPPKRDLRIGCRMDTTEDSLQFLRYWTAYGKIASLQPPPKSLFLACSESRRVACSKGSFVLSCYERLVDPPAWVDRRIGTVFMSLREAALNRFRSLECEVDAVATLWPKPQHLIRLHQILDSRRAERDSSPVKTIYIGITGTSLAGFQTKVDSVFRDEADFKVVGLSDKRAHGLLGACLGHDCFDYIKSKMYHRDSYCFLEHLKEYWEKDEHAEELRSTWRTLTSGQGHQAPVLEPAIIFSRTRAGTSFGMCEDSQVHEWSAGLLFQRKDVMGLSATDGIVHLDQMKRTPLNCDVLCRGQVSAATKRDME
ncbi:hypothetical protein FSARC_5490 [Fusarium sarcochroum]|uniref:2EXR domain-containing protein n=1 Tax=Fusarium sarcochroum TaxID=1208366 RepID=A0A8H4TZI9_9HYPO|nr:hypothetical protein FSARC_5490 [Fusarium sarcochroum]